MLGMRRRIDGKRGVITTELPPITFVSGMEFRIITGHANPMVPSECNLSSPPSQTRQYSRITTQWHTVTGKIVASSVTSWPVAWAFGVESLLRKNIIILCANSDRFVAPRTTSCLLRYSVHFSQLFLKNVPCCCIHTHLSACLSPVTHTTL